MQHQQSYAEHVGRAESAAPILTEEYDPMPIMNIIDHRKRPYRFLKINAIIEPTRHDNSVRDADQADGMDEWIGYAEREHIELADAVEWAEACSDDVTLFIYDEDGGLYERRASEQEAPHGQ